MKPEQKSNTISLRVSMEMKEALAKKARASSKSISCVITELITSYLHSEPAVNDMDMIIASTKKISLLLLAQNPNISLIKKEVENLLCLEKK